MSSSLIFTARCYASAVYAVVLCLSVRHKLALYRKTGQIRLVLSWELPSTTYLILRYKEVRVPLKIRVGLLPSGRIDYYKSVDCSPLTPSLRFLLDLSYNLLLQLCSC